MAQITLRADLEANKRSPLGVTTRREQLEKKKRQKKKIIQLKLKKIKQKKRKIDTI